MTGSRRLVTRGSCARTTAASCSSSSAFGSEVPAREHRRRTSAGVASKRVTAYPASAFQRSGADGNRPGTGLDPRPVRVLPLPTSGVSRSLGR